MSQANIDLVRRAWAAYNSGDVEAFRQCLTDDWREYGPGGPDAGFGTLEDERETMEQHSVAFPDKHTEIHWIVADEDTVACFCTVSATHTGPYYDLEPTSKRVVVHEMMFNRVRDGRLAETCAMTEGVGFYKRISGREPPGHVDNIG